jgi:hypothetical protein
LLSRIVKHNVEFIADLSVGIIGNTNAARLRNGFEPCSDVDVIAEYVAVIFNNITNIDTDSELNSTMQGYVRIALGHAALNIDRAPQRVYNAIEFGEKPIAGVLDDVSAMGRNLWSNQDPQMFLQPDVRAFFVYACQTTIAGDIGGEYGCKPSH